MGVLIDRGLTHCKISCVKLSGRIVEMGVLIDRGLTHCFFGNAPDCICFVEMGVLIDRGLTPFHPPVNEPLRF